MTDYLGPRVRLDDLYVKSVMDGLNASAEGWHDDNVGYRVKVFMVFDTEGSPSGTVVVPTERPHLYDIRIGDEISRFLFKPKTDDRPGAVRVAYQPGDCLVFDTNIPHRGDYHSGQGIRYCVVAGVHRPRQGGCAAGACAMRTGAVAAPDPHSCADGCRCRQPSPDRPVHPGCRRRRLALRLSLRLRTRSGPALPVR